MIIVSSILKLTRKRGASTKKIRSSSAPTFKRLAKTRTGLEELRRKRVDQIKKQKNFFPTLVLNIILWFFLILIVLFIDPLQKGILEIFLVLLLLSLFVTLSLLLGHTRRGAISAISIVVFTILMYFGEGSLLNLLLITGAAVAFEIYFTRKN